MTEKTHRRRPATGRTAAFFDLDKTIIATSSSQAFSKPFIAGGLIKHADVLRTAYAHFLFLVGNADEDQTERMRAHLSALAQGWDVRKVREIVAETVHEYIDPYVYAEAVELIEDHHALGHDVVVVSASGAELVEPIAEMLGADHVLATRMEVVDDHFTGEIDFYNYGENKAVGIRELAERQGYDLAGSFAYSDSVTDVPMLEVVRHAFVVNPDRTLRRRAVESGWGILRFTRPVALRPRVEPLPVAAVVGGLAIAATAVIILRHLRRRRHRP